MSRNGLGRETSEDSHLAPNLCFELAQGSSSYILFACETGGKINHRPFCVHTLVNDPRSSLLFHPPCGSHERGKSGESEETRAGWPQRTGNLVSHRSSQSPDNLSRSDLRTSNWWGVLVSDNLRQRSAGYSPKKPSLCGWLWYTRPWYTWLLLTST